MGKINKKFIALLLAVVLLVNAAPFDALANADTLSSDNVQVNLEKKDVTVGDTFELVFNSTDKNKNITFEVPDGLELINTEDLIDVKDKFVTIPGGKESHINFLASKAGSFVISYTDGEESDEIPVTVKEDVPEVIEEEPKEDSLSSDEVEEPKEETDKSSTNTEEEKDSKNESDETKELKQSTISPYSMVDTDGGLSVTFKDYNQSVGLDSVATMDIIVKFDFEGDTSSNKQLKINIPEGLRLIQIPVAGSYNTDGVDTSILNPINSNEAIYSGINSVSIPKKIGKDSPYNMTYGEVVYNFKSSVERGELTFRINVDNARYYAEHVMKKPVSIQLTSDLKNDVVERKLHLVGGTNFRGDLFHFKDGTSIGVQSSTAKTNTFSITGQGTIGNPRFGYYQNPEIHAYYPEGMKNPKIKFLNYSGSDYTTEIDEVNNKIITKFSNDKLIYELRYYVEYDIPMNTAPKEYKSKEKDFVNIEHYDGTIIKKTTPMLYSVKVEQNIKEILKVERFRGFTNNDENGAEVVSYLATLNARNPYNVELNNQVLEMNFGHDMEVYVVNFPVDITRLQNEYKIHYKTNKKDWKTSTKSVAHGTASSPTRQVTTSLLGLDIDEYFTDIRIEIGSFSPDYIAFHSEAINDSKNSGIYGVIKEGKVKANFSYEIYNSEDRENSNVTGNVEILNSSQKTRSTSSQSQMGMTDGNSQVSNLEPGDLYYLEGNINLYQYTYGTDTLLNKPVIYIRELKNTEVDIKKSVIYQNISGQERRKLEYEVDWDYEIIEGLSGEKIYHIKFINNAYVGYYLGRDLSSSSLDIKVPYNTDRKLKGSFDVRDIFGFGKEGYTALNAFGIGAIDIHDLNGNGNTSEYVLSTGSRRININDLNSVLVDTFISVQGEGNQLPFDPNNPETIVSFNPGMKLDYDIVLSNYTIAPVDDLIMYIPIPKTNQDFGTEFQDAPFTWNMKLDDVIELPDELKDKLDVGYGVNVNKNNYETAEYFGSVQYMNQVNMLRIKSKPGVKMPVDAVYNLRIPMTVDETYNSATIGGKIGKMNVYKPKTWVDSATYTGPVPGVPVGAKLIITEIGGKVFFDINNDGINEDTSFTNIPGHTVSLYKKDDDTGEYVPALKPGTSEHITTKTDGNGQYKFEYEDGLREGIYAVKFEPIDGYSFTMHSDFDRNLTSNAIYKKDYPEVGDDYVGWIIDITSTAINSDKMNAGYIQYTADDLGISILDKTRRIPDTGSVSIPFSELTISPDFFEKIKAETDTYVWSATANGNQVDLVADADGDVVINAKPLAGGSVDVKVKVTIKDMYGNTKDSNEVIITVYSTTPPTVTGTDLWVSVGEERDLYDGVSAVDNADNNITLTNSNKNVSHSIPMANNKFTTAGTYEAEYTIKDSNGIEGVGTRLVKVVGLAEIDAAPQVYSITDQDIKGLVEASASATYLAAPASIGSGIETNTSVTMRIVDGPSVSFSEPGLYTVEYKALNSLDKETLKEVKVLVKSETSVTENSVVLDAVGFSVENADAYLLTEALVKDDNHAKVRAYKVKEEDGVIASITEITHKVTVDNTELQAIRSVNKMGNIFDLTFTVNDEDVVSKTVKVAVKGTHTEVVDDYAMTFKDYLVGLNEVPETEGDKIAQVKHKNFGNVSIVNIIDELKNPVTVDVDVSEYTKTVGKHKVTFNAEGLPNVGGELFVTVRYEAVEGVNYKIGIDTIVISVDEAKSILALGNSGRRDYFTDAMNPVVERIDGANHTATAIYDDTNLEAKEGKYHATFNVSVEPQTAIDGTIIVLDKDVVVTEGEYVIAANNFMIGVDNLPTTQQNMVDRAEAVVYSKYDLANDIIHDLGAKTETLLVAEVKEQDVRFTAKTIVGHNNLVADVVADVVKDSVTDGDTYVLRSKDSIRIQKHEAESYISEGLGVNKSIIGVADAEAFKKGELSTKGTVTVLSIDFDETDGGTVTLGVIEDPSITKVVTVQIRGLNDPDLKVDPKTVHVALDETFDYKFGVEAKDKDNPTNVIDWEHGNLTIESLYGAPDAKTLDTSEQGVYTYKYTATDKNGVSVSELRIVVVEDPEYPIDVVGDYYIVAKNIMKKPSDFTNDDDQNKQLILDYSEAYAVHKNTGKKEDVIISDLYDFTNKEGQYAVDAKVDLAEETGIRKILIVLTDGGIDERGDFSITAKNATVGKERAREIIANTDNTELFKEMSVIAIHKTDAHVIPTILVSGKPNSETPEQTHPITYTVSEDTKSEITKDLTIKSDEIVDVKDGIVIGANPFVVGRENIETMNSESSFKEYIRLSNANAHKEDEDTVTYDVRPITFLDKEGAKEQTVTFAVIDQSDNTQVLDEPTVTVKVKVEDDKSETKGKYTLVGEHFTITGAEALTLVNTKEDDHSNDNILLDGGNLRSYLNLDYLFTEAGNPIVLDRSLIKVEKGTYEVTFGLEEESSIRLVLNVYVDAKDGPTLDVSNYSVINLNGSFDPEPEFIEGYDHNDNDRPLVYSDLEVNTDKLKEDVVGMYEVYYSYTDVAGYTVTKTHVVVVDDGSIAHDGDYLIYGENVVLKTEEVSGDVNALVLSKANAKAYRKVNNDGDIELVDPLDITMNASQVKAVVGDYDATIGIKDKTDTKGIKVYVTDGEIHPNDEYTIVTHDISIGQKDAAKDKADLDPIIIRKSGTYAVHKTKPELGTIEAAHNIKTDVKTYDVTYSVVESTESADAKVHVLADDVVENEGYIYVAANSFVVGAENVDGLSDADYVTYAKARAWEEKNDSGTKEAVFVGPRVDKTKVDVLQETTYGVNLDDDLLDKPRADVNVKVLEGKTDRGDAYTLNGKDFTITGAQALLLTNTELDDDTNDDILLLGGELRSFLNNSFDESGTPYVIDRSNIRVTRNSYEVTFGIEQDDTVTLTLNVFVDTKKKAELDVDNYSVIDLNGTFKPKDYFNGGTDFNDNDRAIVYNDLVVDTSQVDTSTVGFYEVTYSYTDVANQVTTELHVVAVTDGSIVVDGDYLIYGENVVLKTEDVTGDVNALVKSKANVNAYKKVNAEGKIEVVSNDDITMNADDVKPVVGDYNATIGIVNASDTKGIKVYVTDGEIHPNDEYTIVTDNTTIGQEDAAKSKAELDPIIITKSGTYAVHKTKEDLGTIKASHDIKTDVKTYDVTYSVVESTESADAKVHVVADEIVENEGYIYVAANSFVVGADNVDGLSDADYVTYAKARAWEEKNDSGTKEAVFVGPRADKNKIDVLQPVEYGVTLDDDLIDKPRADVNVKVLEGRTDRGDAYTLNGKDFKITGSQALLLTNTEADDDSHDDILLIGGELRSFLNNSFDEEGEPYVIDRSNIRVTKDTYEVTFGVREDATVELVLNVFVDTKKQAELDVDNYSVINLNGTFDPEDYYHGGTDFNDNDRAIEYSELTVDTSKVDTSSVGFYDVTYSYTDAAGHVTTELHIVTVTDGSIVVDGDYLIYGENVVLKTEEVTGDVDALVLSKANVKAYLKSNEDGNIQLVDASELTMNASDVKAIVGDYDATIGIKDKTDTKGIKVYVTDGEIHPNDEYTIVTHDISIGQKDAAKDKADLDPIIIRKSGTYAVHKTKPELGTIEASHNIKPDVKTYDVTYSVVESTESADAKVHVLADDVVENEGYIYVAANSFVVGADNVDSLSDADYVTYAKARAWEEKNDSGTKEAVFVGPVLDKTILDQTQDLEYGVNLDDQLLDQPRAHVKALVLDGRTDRGDEYTLYGKDFEISGAQAYTLVNTEDDSNDDILLTGGSLTSYLNNSFDPSGEPVVLDRDAIRVENGTFVVTFGVNEDPSVELALNVTVKMPKETELNIKPLKEIKVGEVFDAEEQFIDGYDYGLDSDLIFTDLEVDTTRVNTNVKGIYEVPYTYVDSAGRLIERIHVLVVNDGSIVIDEDEEFIIDANNFMIKDVDVVVSDDAVISKSNAKAYKVSDNSWTDLQVNDFGGYSKDLGRYTIQLQVVEHTTVVKDIIAEVVYGGIQPGVNYLISAHDITIGYKDALAMTDEKIIERADAVAIHKSLNKEGTVVIRETDFESRVGSYYVIFEVQEDPTTFIQTKITVLEDDHVVEDKDYIIAASDFAVGDQFILEMNKEDLVALANAKAWAKENPSVMLDVTQTEDIITAIGDHRVSFHMISNPDISVTVDKTIFKDVMYHIEGFDAEIDIDDLSRAINAGRLDETVLEISKSSGYRINSDGSRETMPVYVADNSALRNAGVGQKVEVILTLENPHAIQTRDTTSDHRIEDAQLPIFVEVTAREKDKDRGSVNTGLFDDTGRLIMILGSSTMLALLLLMNEKKKRKLE